MGYLIGQILVCLLAAGVLGWILGWLLRSIGQRRKVETLESDWRDRLYAAERERDDFYRNREEMAARLSTVEQENDDRLARIRSLERELEDHPSEPDSDLDPMTFEREIAERDESILSLQREVEELQYRSQEAEAQLAEAPQLSQDGDPAGDPGDDLRRALAEVEELNAARAVAQKQEVMRTEELSAVRTTLSSVRGDLLESERARQDLEERLLAYEARSEAAEPEPQPELQPEGASEGWESQEVDISAIADSSDESAAHDDVSSDFELQEGDGGDESGDSVQASDGASEPVADDPVLEDSVSDDIEFELLSIDDSVDVIGEDPAQEADAEEVEISETSESEARPSWLLEAPDEGTPDNLKKIRGVGPVLERMMNELGVFHFHQIADWTPADVDWIASHIDTFPDRIERDGWIRQARELAAKKS